MKPAKLKKKLIVHNNTKLALAIGLGLFSIFLFALSFVVAKAMVNIILSVFLENPEVVAHWIAVAFLIVLIIEGLRKARYFIEEQSVGESFDPVNKWVKGSRFHFDRGRIYLFYLLSHLFFSAPYAVLRSVEEFRKITKASSAVLTQASNVLTILKQNPKRWTPCSQLEHLANGLIVLNKMDLVWIEEEESGCVCRIADN